MCSLHRDSDRHHTASLLRNFNRRQAHTRVRTRPLLQPPLLLTQAGFLLRPPLCRQVRVLWWLLPREIAYASLSRVSSCAEPVDVLSTCDSKVRNTGGWASPARLVPQGPEPNAGLCSFSVSAGALRELGGARLRLAPCCRQSSDEGGVPCPKKSPALLSCPGSSSPRGASRCDPSARG